MATISNHPRGKEVAYQKIDSKYVGNPSRRFLANRDNGNRFHVAIDLYANYKDPVISCENGEIVSFYHFYHGAWALLVKHDDIVINYGEVDADSLKISKLKIGDKVTAGQQIGIVEE
ncbi:MAG: peptidoglycan DD-metalloendopeptidase family protein [Saprospiraceae bacterium]|nr:peptidoglycan DD-metalloendopeptidase family protein [Saprospiraceae bacterium]